MPCARIHANLDLAGAGLSLACAIHCMAAPLLILILPLMGLGFLMTPGAERIMVAGSVLLAATSLSLGYRKHRSRRAISVFGIGVILLFSRELVAGGDCCAHGCTEVDCFKLAIYGAGGLALTVAHIINHRLCRHCSHCASELTAADNV